MDGSSSRAACRNGNLETEQVDIIYPNAEIMAVYLPNAYNNWWDIFSSTPQMVGSLPCR